MLSIWICSQQDSILVLCVPPACQLYVFWWLPLGGDRFSSEHIWTSLQWWPPDVSYQQVGFTGPMCMCGGGRERYLLCDLSNDLDTLPQGQTCTCENITFPKLRLREVINFGHVRRLQSDSSIMTSVINLKVTMTDYFPIAFNDTSGLKTIWYETHPGRQAYEISGTGK